MCIFMHFVCVYFEISKVGLGEAGGGRVQKVKGFCGLSYSNDVLTF